MAVKRMDMTKGNMIPQLITFALPVLATSFLEQFFNSADSAVVGQFSGPMALAAVGSNSALINLLINLFNGLSIGANVVVAKYIGEGREEKVGQIVPTIIVTAISGGLLLAVLGIFISKPILELISTPAEIIDLSALYLKIYFSGMPFVMLFNFGSAILRSYGDTRRPLYALMFAGFFNIALNLFFVIVLGMGVAGVAWATVISNAISSNVVLIMLLVHKGCIKLNFKDFKFDTATFKDMFTIGMPAGFQGMLFSISNISVQGGVNSFGAYAVAGTAAAANIEHFSFYFCSSFQQAAVTFTSQNYGSGNQQRCNDVYKNCMILALLSNFAFDIICTILRRPIISIFTTDPQAMNYAFTKMFITLVPHCLCNSYEIPAACMRGFGKSMKPALITLFCCCGLRLIWIFAILPFHHTYSFLLSVYVVSWICAAVPMNIAYFRLRKQMF